MVNKFYLKVFQIFNRLTVRMKISFESLVQQKCLKALFLEAILSSYRVLRARGVVRPCTTDAGTELEPKTVNLLLRGRLTFLDLVTSMAERRKVKLPGRKRVDQTNG